MGAMIFKMSQTLTLLWVWPDLFNSTDQRTWDRWPKRFKFSSSKLTSSDRRCRTWSSTKGWTTLLLSRSCTSRTNRKLTAKNSKIISVVGTPMLTIRWVHELMWWLIVTLKNVETLIFVFSLLEVSLSDVLINNYHKEFWGRTYKEFKTRWPLWVKVKLTKGT